MIYCSPAILLIYFSVLHFSLLLSIGNNLMTVKALAFHEAIPSFTQAAKEVYRKM